MDSRFIVLPRIINFIEQLRTLLAEQRAIWETVSRRPAVLDNIEHVDGNLEEALSYLNPYPRVLSPDLARHLTHEIVTKKLSWKIVRHCFICRKYGDMEASVRLHVAKDRAVRLFKTIEADLPNVVWE